MTTLHPRSGAGLWLIPAPGLDLPRVRLLTGLYDPTSARATRAGKVAFRTPAAC
jgi:hypothetical protein